MTRKQRYDRNKSPQHRFSALNRLMGASIAKQPMTEADIDPYELIVLEAVECICKGIGTAIHWDRIAKAICEAWVFANDGGIGEEAKPYLVVAKDGMERMNVRFRETGKMEFDALGLEAVRRAIELWREQLKMSTVGELSAAADVVHREFYRKEAA
jgi:hypothetical protein